MLVLSRKANESIMIGDDIEVSIIEIAGKSIKLGIAAPKDVVVHRKEVYEAIKNENLQAVRKEAPKDNIVSLLEYFNKQHK